MYTNKLIIGWIAAAGMLTAAAGCRVVSVDETGPVAWTRAYLVSPAPGSPAVLYLWITNPTSHADTATAVRVIDADSAQMHRTMAMGDGMEHMAPEPTLAVPAHDTVKFVPGGLHIMVFGLGSKVAPGDSTAVTVTFRKAGEVQGWAQVITYAQVDSLVLR
ncbi:MAG: copper chaperone PCu(A)C [Gemmatimonadaceae bacterium]|nr:copper chaperone PCu(A)C [Gemmatimonadaceae bacterium]